MKPIKHNDKKVFYKNITAVITSLLLTTSLFSQTIPEDRIVDWKNVGTEWFNNSWTFLNIEDFNGSGNGVDFNDEALINAINSLNNMPGTIEFGYGTYLFDHTIYLPSSITLRGKGADSTILRFSPNANLHLINVSGSIEEEEIPIIQTVNFGQDFILAESTDGLELKDYIQLSLNDVDLVTSDWALNTVGQIVKIQSIQEDTLFLDRQIRLDYPIDKAPFFRKLLPKSNVSVECLKIIREGADTLAQGHNILFQYATNCRIIGIESDSTDYSHITIKNSSNIDIKSSFFHNAFAYGEGGEGYGVTIYYGTGDCLVENNTFQKLRHSVLLQAGANGNVIGYNYSTEPYWDQPPFPTFSAGDLVLHGNYPYANLFEGNIAEQIVVDDSHGINGPYNTFFRNRLKGFGIFMNNNPASDNQNFVGNEITNMDQYMGLLSIYGENHFLYGNNRKGTIYPEETDSLPEKSYYLLEKPDFLDSIEQFPVIGTPNEYESGINDALFRYNKDIYTLCIDEVTLSLEDGSNHNNIEGIIYPNPSSKYLNIRIDKEVNSGKVIIYNMLGIKVIEQNVVNGEEIKIEVSELKNEMYFVIIETNNSRYNIGRFLKID